MFKKFVKEENLISQSQVKSSAARGIRAILVEQMPTLAGIIDDIIPKKCPLFLGKCTGHINFIVVDSEVLFFNERDGPYYPTLKLLHKYPDILPHVQVDRGAIKYVMQGANIMCPGLTSAGGNVGEEITIDTIVSVMAEGKQSALSIGRMQMSGKDIKEKNKGIALENVHYLSDGLWKLNLTS